MDSRWRQHTTASYATDECASPSSFTERNFVIHDLICWENTFEAICLKISAHVSD